MVLLARFCSSLHYNSDNNYLFVNTIEIYNFKADNGRVNFSTQFCLGSIYIINLPVLSQKMRHLKEILMIFQSIMMLLINLTNI